VSSQRLRYFVHGHGFAAAQAALDVEPGVLTLVRSVADLRRRRLH